MGPGVAVQFSVGRREDLKIVLFFFIYISRNDRQSPAFFLSIYNYIIYIECCVLTAVLLLIHETSPDPRSFRSGHFETLELLKIVSGSATLPFTPMVKDITAKIFRVCTSMSRSNDGQNL